MPRVGGLAALRLLLTAALLATLACAFAQDDRWTVQVIALRDYREAQTVAAELRQFNLDAYTEFAMEDGKQFVRVRVGCFEGREAAEAVAGAIRGRLTAEAELVEFTQGAQVAACVQQTVGFLDDYGWRYLGSEGGVPAFAVSVAGMDALVAHDGDRWWVVQGNGPPPAATAAEALVSFAQRRHAGVMLVSQVRVADELVVCPGALVTASGEWAIVDRGDAVVACRLVPVTSGGS